MAGRGAEWPILVAESQEYIGSRLFSDGNVPPAFVRTWYDEGETGLVESPDPNAAVTLIGIGLYDGAEAELLSREIALEADPDQDRVRDELLDEVGVMQRRRGAAEILLTEQLQFDPRNVDLVTRSRSESLEVARALAARVFMAGSIEPPQQ